MADQDIMPNPNEASAMGYPGGEQKLPLDKDEDAPAKTPSSSSRKSAGSFQEAAQRASLGVPAPSALGGSRKSVPNAPLEGLDAASQYRMAQSERNVRFNETNNTVSAYTPSDSSEEWDPNANDSDEDSCDEAAPQELVGYLWKRSPSRMIFCKYQKRYFRIKAGKLHWWYDDADYKKGKKRSRGFLDLKVNPTSLVDDGNSRFTLQPQSGKWSSGGKFTGADIGRKFYLDATDSEHKAAEWMRVFKLHLDYASQM